MVHYLSQGRCVFCGGEEGKEDFGGVTWFSGRSSRF